MTNNKFNKIPFIKCSDSDKEVILGWNSIFKNISSNFLVSDSNVVAVEFYQGVMDEIITKKFKTHFHNFEIIETSELLLPHYAIEQIVQPDLTDDPVFGKITVNNLIDFFDKSILLKTQREIQCYPQKNYLVIGAGASLLNDNALTVYFDVPRWEIIQRMRNNLVSNLFSDNKSESHKLQYKRAFFLDWRILDKHKTQLFNNLDFIVDSVVTSVPKMITGNNFRYALTKTTTQPFELVPFFDPGPWGGQWMKEKFNLDKSQNNFAWCFNCVPEENSLLLKFGDVIFETPSINLVLFKPKELLGENVFNKFGSEFPIRFDFLDTMDGGNLSLQVHPTEKYIKDNFRMSYTQDESYYILDAKDDANVFLGIKENINNGAMIDALNNAQSSGEAFHIENYINKLPAKKHDHFLIPAGTIHCSGKNSMVLEISTTPYIFTFKLWDWDRLDLDGTPRTINIEHGKNVINWGRNTTWVKDNLVNKFEAISQNENCREEKTGLHELEFIETRRHWFREIVEHHTNGTVNVLNLVEGEQVIVESPTNSFTPMIINYAETFIIPASVIKYTIKPHGNSIGKECATIKAYVRN